MHKTVKFLGVQCVTLKLSPVKFLDVQCVTLKLQHAFTCEAEMLILLNIHAISGHTYKRDPKICYITM